MVRVAVVENVTDIRNSPLEHFVRIGSHKDLDRLIRNGGRTLHIGDIFFRYITHHPDRREIGNHKQFLSGFDQLAFGEIPRDHPAGKGRHNGNLRADRLGPLQGSDLLVVHA